MSLGPDEGEERPSRIAFRRFLHTQSTGCEFIGSFLKKGKGIRWVWVEGEAPTADDLSAQVAAAEGDGELVGIVLPEVKASEIGALVDDLGATELWVVDRDNTTLEDMEIIKLFWLNAAGERCSALGMAPLFTMPPTRRASHLSMFIWPGPRANPKRPKYSAIGMGDLKPPRMAKTKYKEKLRKSRRVARDLNGGELPENTTFIVPR